MKKSNAIKVCLSVALLAGAGLLLFGFLSHGDGISEKTYFYDLSEKKLFAASREELPPIRGLNDAEEDAVRAVTPSPRARCAALSRKVESTPAEKATSNASCSLRIRFRRSNFASIVYR